jgi:hypothetical protein
LAPEEAQVLPVVGFVPVGRRLLHNGVTLLPVPGIPLALNIVRSPAESPFLLESTPLCGFSLFVTAQCRDYEI